ncbi:MAG TPA: TldD/PmbA family protein, partial [Dehalococcoidales bacterium]
MADIVAVGHELTDALRRYHADYIELRLEESQSSHIVYRGRELESIDRATAIGGNVRALVKGGWGFVSFNDFGELPGRIELAVKQAQFVGHEKSQLAEVAPVVDKVLAGVSQNPVTMPLAEKKQLLDEYNDIIWRTPRIQTSTIHYGDGRKRVVFLNSAGTFVEQERMDITIRLTAVAAKDGDVQQAGLSLGSRGDFNRVKGLHQPIAEMAQRAVELLSAQQVKGGEYTVVLDPVLAGVFAHVAFGHLSESDFLYEN